MVSELRAELDLCNRCGFCQSSCPVFRETGTERTVARGRMALLQKVRDGDIPPGRDLSEVLYDCTLCGSCAENCPLGVDVPELVIEAREKMAGLGPLPSLISAGMNAVLPRRAILEYASAALRLYQGTGLRKLAGRLGVLPGQESLLPPEIKRSFRSTYRPRSGGKARVLYFLGCATNLFYPEVAVAVMDSLIRAGEEVDVAPNTCCGIPALAYGNRDLARKLSRQNLDALKDYDTIITDCASCASTLKDYPRWLKDDPEWEKTAQEISGRVRGFSEYLAERDVALSSPARAVTVHYPCHMARYQENSGLLDELLSRVRGIEVRPMEGARQCCGGAGTYALTHPGLGSAIVERKAGWARATGARLLVTECPACISQLGRALKGEVDVVHIAQVVAGTV